MAMLNTVQDQVGRMSAAELNLVVESIKLRRTFLARQTTNSINKGDKVQFDGGPKHGVITGKVVKVNIKTIVVDTINNTWKVSANLITKV
jgi:preprotein translocase subunit YajC